METYRQIKAYVTETGLDWEPYRKMLPRRWQWLVGPIAELHKAECADALTAESVTP